VCISSLVDGTVKKMSLETGFSHVRCVFEADLRGSALKNNHGSTSKVLHQGGISSPSLKVVIFGCFLDFYDFKPYFCFFMIFMFFCIFGLLRAVHSSAVSAVVDILSTCLCSWPTSGCARRSALRLRCSSLVFSSLGVVWWFGCSSWLHRVVCWPGCPVGRVALEFPNSVRVVANTLVLPILCPPMNP
jgi:hypothetical protein